MVCALFCEMLSQCWWFTQISDGCRCYIALVGITIGNGRSAEFILTTLAGPKWVTLVHRLAVTESKHTLGQRAGFSL